MRSKVRGVAVPSCSLDKWPAWTLQDDVANEGPGGQLACWIFPRGLGSLNNYCQVGIRGQGQARSNQEYNQIPRREIQDGR